MSRSQTLNLMRAAGYNRDSRAWTDLLIRNKVSYTVAWDAYLEGKRAYAAGMKCPRTVQTK